MQDSDALLAYKAQCKLAVTQKLPHLREQMRNAKIHAVEVNYSGSGDDGAIQSITFYRWHPHVTEAAAHTVIEAKRGDFDNNPFSNFDIYQLADRLEIEALGTPRGGTFQFVDSPISNEEELKDFCYDYLQDVPYDWVNNDGGFGTIVWLPGPGLWIHQGHQNISTHEALPLQIDGTGEDGE